MLEEKQATDVKMQNKTNFLEFYNFEKFTTIITL